MCLWVSGEFAATFFDERYHPNDYSRVGEKNENPETLSFGLSLNFPSKQRFNIPEMARDPETVSFKSRSRVRKRREIENAMVSIFFFKKAYLMYLGFDGLGACGRRLLFCGIGGGPTGTGSRRTEKK